MQLNQEPEPNPLEELTKSLKEANEGEAEDILSQYPEILLMTAYDAGPGCVVDYQCSSYDGKKIAAALLSLATTALASFATGTGMPVEAVLKTVESVLRKTLEGTNIKDAAQNLSDFLGSDIEIDDAFGLGKN